MGEVFGYRYLYEYGGELMRQTTVQFAYDEEKLEALKIFIDGKDVDIEAEMVQAMEDLYCKHVPVRVREYIAKKSIQDSSKSNTSSSRK